MILGELFQLLTSLPAIAFLAVIAMTVIAGLGYIIYLLVEQNRSAARSMEALRTNDLHEIPEIANTLRRIETSLHSSAAASLGQLADIRESLAYIKARIERRTDI